MKTIIGRVLGGRRRAMLIAAIFLALVAGVLPIVVSFYLSDVRAVRAERDHLSQYATWTMQRAQRNLISAMHTLKMIDDEGWSDCSAAHVDRMRALANETAAVESVGYLVTGASRAPVGGRFLPGLPRRCRRSRWPTGFR